MRACVCRTPPDGAGKKGTGNGLGGGFVWPTCRGTRQHRTVRSAITSHASNQIIGKSVGFNYHQAVQTIMNTDVYTRGKTVERLTGRHHRLNSSPIRVSSITHNACCHTAYPHGWLPGCMLMCGRRDDDDYYADEKTARRSGALDGRAGAFTQSQFPSHCQRRYLCYLSTACRVQRAQHKSQAAYTRARTDSARPHRTVANRTMLNTRRYVQCAPPPSIYCACSFSACLCINHQLRRRR